MAKSIFSLRIKEIADLSGKHPLWKVHWIGELGINGKTDEPIIDLWLVPYKSSSLYNSGLLTVVENDEYVFSEMRTVSIGVGQLPVVSIGSFFKEGIPFGRASQITRTFKFTPTNNNQEIINLGSSWTDDRGIKRFYIPTNQFRGLRNQALKLSNKGISSGGFPFVLSADSVESLNQNKSENILKGKCVLIRFGNREKSRISKGQYPFYEKAWRQEIVGFENKIENRYDGLIVPCIELVKFYYANSSQMFLQIFKDGLLGDDNRVFKSRRTVMPDTNGENGFIYLSKQVKNIDLPLVARLAFDPYALKQARKIYYSLLAADKLKDGKVPETLFPFIDQQTKLKVHGIPIQSGNKRYFLVNWIESCTAAFPFTDLKFWRENPGRMIKEPPGKDFNGNPSSYNYPDDYSPTPNTKTRRRHKYQSNNVELVSDVPPSTARGELEILLPLNKFPDLQNKNWEAENPNPNSGEKTNKDDQQCDGVNIQDIAVPTELGSTASRSGTKKVTKITIGAITEESTGEVLNLEDDIKYKRTILFRGIADAVNLEGGEEFTAELVYLLAESVEFTNGDSLSKFPAIDFNKITVNKNRIEKLADQSVYIMEINFTKDRRESYAYLFDIIPKSVADKISHCFCLVFKRRTLDALTGVEIENLLTECLKNNGTWFALNHQIQDENTGEQKTIFDRKMQRVVGNLLMIKINHRDMPAQYFAELITEKLKQVAGTISIS
jgi:hypothetical protein